MVTNFIIQHNLPLATAGYLAPLFKNIFPDSDIGKWYASGRSKSNAIVDKAMSPHCHEYLVQYCKEQRVSLGINGSSNTDVNKINPVTLRIFSNRQVFYHYILKCPDFALRKVGRSVLIIGLCFVFYAMIKLT